MITPTSSNNGWEDRSYLSKFPTYQAKLLIREKPLACAVVIATLAVVAFSLLTLQLLSKSHPFSKQLIVLVSIIGVIANFVIKRTLFVASSDIGVLCTKSRISFTEQSKSLNAKKPTCLILEVDDDHNYAFRNYDGFLELNKKYTLVHTNVSSIQEINQAIDRVTKLSPIALLWISAHGKKKEIHFSDEILGLDNVAKLEGLNKLRVGAKIVLHSCSVAKGENNIAKKLSEFAKDHLVIGSKKSFLADRVAVFTLMKAPILYSYKHVNADVEPDNLLKGYLNGKVKQVKGYTKL